MKEMELNIAATEQAIQIALRHCMDPIIKRHVEEIQKEVAEKLPKWSGKIYSQLLLDHRSLSFNLNVYQNIAKEK